MDRPVPVKNSDKGFFDPARQGDSRRKWEIPVPPNAIGAEFQKYQKEGANPNPVLLPRVSSGQQPVLNPTIPTAGHPQRFLPPRGRLPLSAMVFRRWRPRPAVRADGDQCLPAPLGDSTSPVSPNVSSIHPESHNRDTHFPAAYQCLCSMGF